MQVRVAKRASGAGPQGPIGLLLPWFVQFSRTSKKHCYVLLFLLENIQAFHLLSKRAVRTRKAAAACA